MQSKLYVRKDFSFRKNHSKNLIENLDDFKRLTNEFNQLGERLEVENETAILINSLRDIYRKVKSALKYGRGLVLVDATTTT